MENDNDELKVHPFKISYNEVINYINCKIGLSFNDFDCFIRKRFQLQNNAVVIYLNESNEGDQIFIFIFVVVIITFCFVSRMYLICCDI